jgi:hypothetical protein
MIRNNRIIYAYELMNRIYSITAWWIMGVRHLRKNTIQNFAISQIIWSLFRNFKLKKI